MPKPLRFIRMLCLPLLLTARFAGGVESLDEAYAGIMSGDDYTEKKELLIDLRQVSDDDVVLHMLVAAVADRQIGEYAVGELRRRTGLVPSPQRGGNPGYPGYPADDGYYAWDQWLSQRQRIFELERNIDQIKRSLGESAREQREKY